MEPNNKNFLQKVAQFTKLAISKVEEQEDDLQAYKKKEAADYITAMRLQESLKKAANALYESDFLADEVERRQFIKQAMEDPSFLARTIEKVCNAADVALIGKPARVASKRKEAQYDPVMARAFGNSVTNSIIDE